MDARTLARILAVQALYQQDIGQEIDAENQEKLDAKIKELSDTNDIGRINKPLFKNIIGCVSRETLSIKAKIVDNLSVNWSIERIGGVLRAILSAAIAERIINPEMDKRVLVSEYVAITSGFYDDKEVKFVNAILDKIL
jgi:N utilization substance protein B